MLPSTRKMLAAPFKEMAAEFRGWRATWSWRAVGYLSLFSLAMTLFFVFTFLSMTVLIVFAGGVDTETLPAVLKGDYPSAGVQVFVRICVLLLGVGGSLAMLKVVNIMRAELPFSPHYNISEHHPSERSITA